MTNKNSKVLYTGVTNDLKEDAMNIKKSRLRDLQRDIILLSWFTTKFIEMPKKRF